ncbi:MAG: hypothetical protein ACRDWY_06375 [Actinomycetes bacterium]
MPLFRRRVVTQEIVPAAIPEPRFSIDGWTLAGTPLATKLTSKLARPDLRELETLLHGVAVKVDTPYTYERAAVLLERGDEPGPALSVCEMWLAHPAARWPEYVHHTRAIDKHRARLRTRLGTRPANAAAG